MTDAHFSFTFVFKQPLNKFGSLESQRTLTFLKFDLSKRSRRWVLSVNDIPSI